jgi:hypothetical protein
MQAEGGGGQQRCMVACGVTVQELHDDDMQQIEGGWCTLLPAGVFHRAPPAAAARCLLLPMASGSDNRQQQQAAARWFRFLFKQIPPPGKFECRALAARAEGSRCTQFCAWARRRRRGCAAARCQWSTSMLPSASQVQHAPQ